MKLGEKIKLLRTEKEFTQPELSQKAGIEQSYLSKLENDKAVPSFDIINRIAMALESTGMEVIDALSQSYVEDNLSHIPEVAAEYAVIKKKRESTLKKRFVFAALLIIFGIGLVLIGQGNLVYPEHGYKYESGGVIKAGETDQHFSSDFIEDINEKKEEWELRMNLNRSRIDKIYKTIYNTDEGAFIINVDGGRRLFNKIDKINAPKVQNDLILIAGLMLIVSGFFSFMFSVRFKPQ